MRYTLLLALVLSGCTLIKSLDTNKYAPQATLDVSPDEGDAPLLSDLSWSVTDEDGGGVECTLDFGDGASESVPCSGANALFHTYQEPGGYVATLTASDGEFSTQAAVSVKVEAAPLETLEIELEANPDNGSAPLLSELSWTLSRTTDAPCELDFGDGEVVEIESCGEATRLFHTYKEPGGYVAIIRVLGESVGSSVGIRVE